MSYYSQFNLILIISGTLTMFSTTLGMTKDTKDIKALGSFLAQHAKGGTIVTLDPKQRWVSPARKAVIETGRCVIVADPDPVRAKVLGEYHWLNHGLTAESSGNWSSEHGHYNFYRDRCASELEPGWRILQRFSERASSEELYAIGHRATTSEQTLCRHFSPTAPMAIRDEALDYKGSEGISKLSVITDGATLRAEQQQLFPYFSPQDVKHYIPRVRIVPVGWATQIDGVWIDTRKALAEEIAARDATEIRFYKQQLARVVSLGLLAVSAACTDVLR